MLMVKDRTFFKVFQVIYQMTGKLPSGPLSSVSTPKIDVINNKVEINLKFYAGKHLITVLIYIQLAREAELISDIRGIPRIEIHNYLLAPSIGTKDPLNTME